MIKLKDTSLSLITVVVGFVIPVITKWLMGLPMWVIYHGSWELPTTTHQITTWLTCWDGKCYQVGYVVDPNYQDELPHGLDGYYQVGYWLDPSGQYQVVCWKLPYNHQKQ